MAKTLDRCFAVITLYDPEPACVENVRLISEQADAVYICDNSKTSHEKEYRIADNVRYLFYGENKGLSAAFNTVFREYASDFSDDDFIVFFDQDSTISEGHIKKLMTHFAKLEERGVRVGCLGPVYFNPYNDSVKLPRVRRKITGNVYAVESVITSSMITRFHILKEAGFWNEHVFLDMADWDLCWRIRKKGYLCCSDAGILLTHRLGEDSRKEGKNKARSKRLFREYYQTREALYLLHQPYTPLRFRLKFLRQLTVSAAWRLLTFPEKKKRMEIYRRAAKDHKSGKTGPY